MSKSLFSPGNNKKIAIIIKNLNSQYSLFFKLFNLIYIKEKKEAKSILHF
jgi:hypothetical protein